MATAPHDSRVSKAYAPHGYSISQDKLGFLELDSTVAPNPTSDGMPIAFCDNGDAVLKEATLFSEYNPTGDVAGTEYTISVAVMPVGGGAPKVLASVSTHGMPAPAHGPSIGFYRLSIPDGIVPAPGMLMISVDEIGGAQPAGGPFEGMVALRYESKA